MALYHYYSWQNQDTLAHVAGAHLLEAGYSDVPTFMEAIRSANPEIYDWSTAPAQYVASGGLPQLAVGSLTVTQPATQAVLVVTGVPTWVTVPAQHLTLASSSDCYVDLSLGGSWGLVAVTPGSGAPPLAPYAIRVYKATTTASSVTSILPLCSIGEFTTNSVLVGQRVALPFTA